MTVAACGCGELAASEDSACGSFDIDRVALTTVAPELAPRPPWAPARSEAEPLRRWDDPPRNSYTMACLTHRCDGNTGAWGPTNP